MDQQELDARMRANALARWEGEGGALVPAHEHDAIDETALRLLARLGASLLESWGDVPTALQARIVRRARTIGAPCDHTRVKENLSSFLAQYATADPP